MFTPRLVLVCFLVSAAGARGAELAAPLEIVRGEGCRYDAQSARGLKKVVGPNADGVIVLEAEDAVRAAFRPDAAPGPSRDPDASGGLAAEALVFARYAFVSPKPQKLVVWARAATRKGPWCFWEFLNGQHVGSFFRQPKGSPATPYHWVRRGERAARRGWNWFDVIEFGYRFPKVDKWVLAPAGHTPRGLGPKAAFQSNASAVAETRDERIPGVLRFLALEGVGDAAVEASQDAGKTWRPVPVAAGRGDLRRVRLDASAPVRFRFRLRPGRAIGPLRLRAEVDPNRCIQLAHGDTRLVFDRETGGLFLMENTKTGDAVVAPGRPRPIVAIDFKKTGEGKWTRISPEGVTPRVAKPNPRRKGRWIEQAQAFTPRETRPESVRVEGDRLELRYLFHAPGLGRARATCVVEPGRSGAWRWSVKTDALDGPADVTAVVFPIFEHVRIGSSGLDDHQLRLQSFGHHRLMPGKAPIRDTRYLGGCVMAWTDVYDARTGFYVGSHDPAATNVLFTSKAGGRTAEFFRMATEKRHQIHPGESRAYEYAVAAHPGGWHWGADRYREWFESAHGRARYPKWLRRCEGWISLQAENYGKQFRFDQLPDWLTRARAIGLDWVQVWGQFAFNGGPCCAALYPPSPMYGGVAGWREGVAEVKRRRGHIGGYFVYDRLTVLPLVTDYFLGHFKKTEYPRSIPWPTPQFFHRVQLVRDPANRVPAWPPPAEEIAAQKKLVEEHQRRYRAGRRPKTVHYWKSVWVNAAEWREFLKRWIVDKYVAEYGCNTAYIDVLGCGGGEESFDPRRGHNGDGEWGVGKMRIAQRVAEAAWKRDPAFALTMEGLGDLPGLYAAPMCSGVYRGGRNVYRYVFPDRVLIHGGSNPGSGGTVISRYLETFVEGMRFDIVGRPTAFPVMMLQHQRQFYPWTYDALFRDTAGLRVSDPRVTARVFLLRGAAAKGVLVTVANKPRLSGARIRIDAEKYGPFRAAFEARVDGRAGRLPVRRDGRWVSLDAADALASTVLLPRADNKTPAVWPVMYLRRYGRPALEVTLFNLTQRRQQGRCAVQNLGFTEPYQDRREEAAVALPFTRTEQSFSLAAWDAAVLRFPLKSLDAHRWTVRVGVAVKPAGAAPVKRTFLAIPLVFDGSWEFRGAVDEFVYHGVRALKLPPSDRGYQHQLPNLFLEPAHRYRLQVQAMRSGFKAKVQGVLLAVRAESNPRYVWRYRGLDRKRPNEWQTLSIEFETPPDLERAGIYLYNVISPDTAWFDDLRVEDLGPVRK